MFHKRLPKVITKLDMQFNNSHEQDLLAQNYKSLTLFNRIDTRDIRNKFSPLLVVLVSTLWKEKKPARANMV